MEESWHKRKTYKSSLSFNSIVGHVLGIGDRHLDNILIDLSTGELLQVDLSVAFGRGLYGLRVAEVVPFRMTRMMVGPLGVTRTHGLKNECIEIMNCVREAKETIVEMLRDTGADTWRKSTSSSSLDAQSNVRRGGGGGNGGGGGVAADVSALDARANEVARRIDGKMIYSVDEKKDSSVVIGVEEQVDYLLEVATSAENLSQMFEGWASWV